MEYITGGFIIAGYHEVVVGQDTLKQIKNVEVYGKSATRVSSTFFAHINSDKYLDVLPQFRTEETVEKYPKIKEGEWLRRLLRQTLIVD